MSKHVYNPTWEVMERFRKGIYTPNYSTSGSESEVRRGTVFTVRKSSESNSRTLVYQKDAGATEKRRVFRRLPPELLDDLPESSVDPVEFLSRSLQEELKSRVTRHKPATAAPARRGRYAGEELSFKTVAPPTETPSAQGERPVGQSKGRTPRRDVEQQKPAPPVKHRGPFKPQYVVRKTLEPRQQTPSPHKHQPTQSVVRQECRQGTVFGVLSTPQGQKKQFPFPPETRQTSVQEGSNRGSSRATETPKSFKDQDKESLKFHKENRLRSDNSQTNLDNDRSKDIVVSSLQSFCQTMLTVKNVSTENSRNSPTTRAPLVSYQISTKNSIRKVLPVATSKKEETSNSSKDEGTSTDKNQNNPKDSFPLRSPKLVKEVLKRMASQPSGRFSDPRGTLPTEFSDEDTESVRQDDTGKSSQKGKTMGKINSFSVETTRSSGRNLPPTRVVQTNRHYNSVGGPVPFSYSLPRSYIKSSTDRGVQNDNLIEEIMLTENNRQPHKPYSSSRSPTAGVSREGKPDYNKTIENKVKLSPLKDNESEQLTRNIEAQSKPTGNLDSSKKRESSAEENELSSLEAVTSGVHPLSNGSLQSDVAVCRPSTSSLDSGMCSPQQSYFVVVAVDFGTTYSGYAFSFTRDPDNVHMMRKWEGGDPGVINQKTPTTVLLTPDEEFHSFGYSARDAFHDLDPEEAKRWLYFEKFKMALHTTENLNHETTIKAANGKTMAAVKIFAHALRYFKRHAVQELSDQSGTTIMDEDIRWVVTVPAIWRQPAKQFMRTAAYEAGIASADSPEQLLIALEPEAASVYCRRLRIHQLVPEVSLPQRLTTRSENSLPDGVSDPAVVDKKGGHYMVVDCGGGTVDITVHEILDDQGTIRELHKATGGPYGSVGIDQEFEKLLNDIFGADFIEQFKVKRPAGYVDLMIAFEARKRNASPFKVTPLNISLPFSFIDYYKKCKNSSVESALKKYGNKDIKWSSQGMLRLDPAIMVSLFQSTLVAIKKHINVVLNAPGIHDVGYLFLVGGFAESQILQKEIREAFSNKVKVIIPQGVSLAILKGAVLFGMDPTVVSARRSRMTYGVGVLNRFIHGVHPTDKLVVKDGVEWCADVFDKFVITDQSVGQGDMVVRSYTPARAGQSCSVIHIYSSEREDAKFITDLGVRRCGSLILDLSEARYLSPTGRREIEMIMIFGDTEIKVTARDITTGKCVKADIDFLNQ